MMTTRPTPIQIHDVIDMAAILFIDLVYVQAFTGSDHAAMVARKKAGSHRSATESVT